MKSYRRRRASLIGLVAVAAALLIEDDTKIARTVQLYLDQADGLARHMCHIDYLTTSFRGIQLIRTGTIANGISQCDFRYKKLPGNQRIAAGPGESQMITPFE